MLKVNGGHFGGHFGGFCEFIEPPAGELLSPPQAKFLKKILILSILPLLNIGGQDVNGGHLEGFGGPGCLWRAYWRTLEGALQLAGWQVPTSITFYYSSVILKQVI